MKKSTTSLLITFCIVLAFHTRPVVGGSPMRKPIAYESFGAKGDGKTDDMPAIARAHAHANKHGLPVKVKKGATYYVSGKSLSAVIKTDADFGTATFIIDDRNVENHRAPVFRILSDLKPLEIKGVTRLTKGQKKLDASPGKPCFVEVYNDDVKLYIRLGKNQNKGSSQRDFFLVDSKGVIDPMTPIIWDFQTISKIAARPVDKELLTVTGGKFITYPPDKVDTRYHHRGIRVERSNVLLKGVRHEIEKEGKDGPPYSGFISVSKAANVTIQDTVFTGRRTYWKKAKTTGRVPMGSYGLSLNSSLNVKLINCSQTNSIHDRKYWGIMGTNFCKNITLEDCSLSRFDAHQGVTNATIRNCTIGYMGIKAIGHGLFTIEATTVQGTFFVDFRPDYGSTWNGDFVLKDCRLLTGHGKDKTATLFRGTNPENHDFGYVCHMPRKVTVENMVVDDSRETLSKVFVFSDYNRAHRKPGYKPAYPIVVTQEVVLKNVQVKSGTSVRLSSNEYLFRDVKLRVEK